ncbi:oligosaccharide repeat unit polymerase, partial [Proteus mirabilis]
LERVLYKLDIYNAIYSYFSFFIFFVFFIFSFLITKKRIKPIYINEYKYSLFILILQCAYFIINIIYNTNVAGHPGRKDMPSAISLFFVFFNPDLLFMIYLFFSKETKIKKLNIIIYLISMSARGWMAGILYIFLYYFISKKYKLKTYVYLITILSIIILLLPFIINIKWYLRSDDTTSFFDVIFNIKHYSVSLLNSLEYLLLRLQHISSLLYISDNINSINTDAIKPYWAEGNIQLFFEKIFNIELQPLSKYIVTDIMGFKDAQWNVHTGVASWFLINPYDLFIFLYVFFLIFMINRLPISYHSNLMQSFILYLTFSRLFVGWTAAYINLIMSLIITMFIFSFMKLKTR